MGALPPPFAMLTFVNSTVSLSKTAVQLFAIALLLAGPAGESILPGTTLAGLTALWLAALLTIYTGYDYFRAGIGHLIDE